MKFGCVFCDRSYVSWRDLCRHKEVRHQGAKMLRCEKCHFTTGRQGDLERHNNREHRRVWVDRESPRRARRGKVRVRDERREQGGQRQLPATGEERPQEAAAVPPVEQAVAEGDVLQIHPSPADAEVVEEHSFLQLLECLKTPSPMSMTEEPSSVGLLAVAHSAPEINDWVADMADNIENMLLSPSVTTSKLDASLVTPPPSGCSPPEIPETPAEPEPEVATFLIPPVTSPRSEVANGDPRVFRMGRKEPPQSAAGGEVLWMRERARQDPQAKITRGETLHRLEEVAVTIRHVTETATFPDGRVYQVSFTEYPLPKHQPLLTTTQQPLRWSPDANTVNHNEA